MTDNARAEQETHARAAHRQEPLAMVSPGLEPSKDDDEDEAFWKQVDRDVEHIRMKLAAWHPGWEDPEQEGRPFPLRYVAPEAAAYLAEYAHFTASDMKYFAWLTGFDFVSGDREDFFDSYLDIVEDEPWLAVAIDFTIAHHRVNASLSGRKKVLRGDSSRVGILLERLPAEKLRLDSRPELAAKLGQLADDADAVVDADVAVAAFYEYAQERHLRRWPDLSPGERMARALDGLRDQVTRMSSDRRGAAGAPLTGPGAANDGETGKTERPGTGDDAARGMPAGDLSGGGLSSGELTSGNQATEGLEALQALLASIVDCVAGLEPTSSPQAYLELSRLATRATEVALAIAERAASAKETLPEIDPSVALARLEALGIPGETEPGAIAWLVGAEGASALADAEASGAALATAAEAMAAASAALMAATSGGRYEELASLGAAATATGSAHADAAAKHAHALAIIRSAVASAAAPAVEDAGGTSGAGEAGEGLGQLGQGPHEGAGSGDPIFQDTPPDETLYLGAMPELEVKSLFPVPGKEARTFTFGMPDGKASTFRVRDPRPLLRLPTSGSAPQGPATSAEDQRRAESATNGAVPASAFAGIDTHDDLRDDLDAVGELGLEPRSGETPEAGKAAGTTDLDANSSGLSGHPADAEAVELEIEPEVAPASGSAVEPVSEPTPEPENEPEATRVSPGFGDDAASRRALADIFRRDLPGIGADAAAAVESLGGRWIVSADALRTVAAARAPQRVYGAEAERFIGLVNTAIAEVSDDLESVILLGGLLRPAIVQYPPRYRERLEELAQGHLGQHLLEVAEAIAALDREFPPSASELARIAGGSQAPQKARIAERLGAWCDTTALRKSRWQFASVFMHHVVSPDGLIGAARAAIDVGRKDSVQLAQRAIERLKGQAMIIARAQEFAVEIDRPGDHLYPKGVEYLDRNFAEAFGYLGEWVQASDPGRAGAGHSEARLRSMVGTLDSRLEKAARQLRAETSAPNEAESDEDALEAVVADWLACRCDDARRALAGDAGNEIAALDEALAGERDLLPAELRGRLDAPTDVAASFVALLTGPGIPSPADAWRRARQDGAFETAARLAHRFAEIPASSADLEEEVRRFVAQSSLAVDTRRRRLNALIKLDFAHQEELAGWLRWCDACRGRFDGLQGTEADLSDIPAGLARLDEVLSEIAGTIREDQANRIREVRTDKNAEEADAILARLAELPPQAVEDRIAQLRDGRSAAIFESDADRLIGLFTPDFVVAASAPGWPKSLDDYRTAFEREGGPLFIDEDRRTAAAELISAYLALGRTLADNPAVQRQMGARVKAFLELVGGFDRVTVGAFSRLPGARAWRARVQAEISTDGWFLPPAFGSQATSGYDLVVAGPDALPETIQRALDPKVPSILLLSGVADFVRRREYAERLRGSSIPALLVDEALVAFAATRRATRARTIFECGLPYGRVEPYTTDAGQIPPEMFFGRHAEIAAIMSKTADGCLVYGGRQLGKSALLHHVHKTWHAPEIDRIVLRREVKPLGSGSEKTSAIWSHLAAMLAPNRVVKEQSRTADEVAADIRRWIALHPHGQIVCMFDETDHFIAAETTSDYRELTRLKELMEDTARAFKVVFAGLHNVQRAFVQPNSPLAHLGQPICIGPLNRTPDDKRAAHDLVAMPMHAAGFRFQDGEAIDEILAWANYYPSLLQEFLKGLLATMHGARSGKTYRLRGDGPLWTIPTAELFDNPETQQIESRVRDKFLLTLGLDARYALVAYTLAWLNAVGNEERVLGSGYDAEALLAECLSFWPKTAEAPSRAAFEALLDEMFGLGVLGRFRTEWTTRYRYCLASRQVATMLGSEDDIVRKLEELADTEPSLSYDRAFHRRAYAPPGAGEAQMHATYAPLTDLQIERLVGADVPGVRIVCGLGLLGLGKVGPALKRLAETLPQLPGASQDTRIEIVLADSYRGLSDAVTLARGAGWLRLVVYKPSDAEEATRLISRLEQHRNVLSRAVRPILLLDAADPGQREIATRRFDDCEWLAAWGEPMLRTHLNDVECSDLDTRKRRAAILAATGGIPSEITLLVREARFADDRDVAIARWKPQLGKVKAAAVGAIDDRVWKAFPLVESDPKPEDYLAMNDLIRDTTKADLVDIGPDLVAMGLVTRWNHAAHRIQRSPLGDLLARQQEG